jgi:hypothetical protein
LIKEPYCRLTLAILLAGLISLSFFFGTSLFQNAYAACTNWENKLDTDCDGIADQWERIDYYDGIAGSGTVPLPGANENHKDIYIELDYMPFHKPRSDSVNDVVTAFRNAPVWNPDGITGVTLHVVVDDTTTIGHTDCTNIWTGTVPNFDSIKRDKIGTSNERLSNPNIYSEKKDVYHYGIFIHRQCGNLGSSGTAERPGNDIIVSLGDRGWATDASGHNVGSRDQQAGTLMHELGHNLNLQHGGNIGENCKPNYLSVMSYSRQFANYVANRPLDYSRSIITSLNENSLSELAGIGASTPAGQSTVIGRINQPSVAETRVVPTGGTRFNYNWWLNSDTDDTGVVSSINNMKITGCPLPASDTLTTLFGYNDWSGMRYWDTTGGGTQNATSSSGNFSGSSVTLDMSGVPVANQITADLNGQFNNNNTNSAIVRMLNNQSVPNLTMNFLSPPCDLTNPLCLDPICDPSDPNRPSNRFQNSCVIITNFTNPNPADDAPPSRDLDHVDVTIQDVRNSRLSLINEIKQKLTGIPGGEHGIPNEDFSNPADAANQRNALVAQLNVIARLSERDRLPDGVLNMLTLRSKMDSSFGGAPVDDVIVTPESQQALVPLMDNFIEALNKQR